MCLQLHDRSSADLPKRIACSACHVLRQWQALSLDLPMKPLPHPAESKRLETLNAFEILDTDAEIEFDDIVKLASAICGAPISVISLLDKERQWFKAEVGLGISETAMEMSMCAHAIFEGSYMEIPDTAVDPRTLDNPLVTQEHALRFYAGAVLTTSDNIPLGTLCVLDYQPKELTSLQRDTLRVLAKQVVTQLELRRYAAPRSRPPHEELAAIAVLAGAAAKSRLAQRRGAWGHGRDQHKARGGRDPARVALQDRRRSQCRSGQLHQQYRCPCPGSGPAESFAASRDPAAGDLFATGSCGRHLVE
jgi:hypothetical protein